MNIALYAVAALITLSVLVNITRVGKPAKPLTGETAAAIVLVNSAIIVIIVLAALRLS